MATPKGVVRTLMPFLTRSALYMNEKPYTVDFDISDIEGAKASNHTFDFHVVDVHDIRESEHPFSIERNGFMVLERNTSLDELNSADPEFIKNIYYHELEALMYEQFPDYARFEILDHQIRKRDENFPEAIGRVVEHSQPASLPHADFTTHGSFLRMEDAFPGQSEYYENENFDIINVWQVLRGPNHDWPLAICDFETIDLGDTIANDVVHKDSVGENCILRYNPHQAWWYLSAQMPHELFVFRNSNSTHAGKPFSPHAAIDTGIRNSVRRESIEVRFAAFRTVHVT